MDEPMMDPFLVRKRHADERTDGAAERYEGGVTQRGHDAVAALD
jgi:hypothetical protein